MVRDISFFGKIENMSMKSKGVEVEVYIRCLRFFEGEKWGRGFLRVVLSLFDRIHYL